MMLLLFITTLTHIIGKKLYMKFAFARILMIVASFPAHTVLLGESASACTRSPFITGYSRPYGASVSLFEFTWKSAACNDGSVLQYQLQYADSCSTRLPVTILTGNNKTSTTIAIPSCAAMDCYIRIRAELNDGSFTDYSSCVLISNPLFMENQSKHAHNHYTTRGNSSCLHIGIVTASVHVYVKSIITWLIMPI